MRSSSHSDAIILIVLGCLGLIFGWSSNPGFRPPGFVPSIWPYVIFVSGGVLVLAGIYLLIRKQFY